MKELSEICATFINEYLTEYPESELLDLIYKYELSLKVDDYIVIIKNNLESIFSESIEKYIFNRYTFDELKMSLSQHSFTIENEYSIVKALTMWLQYDLNNRMEYAQELFKLVTVHLCSNTLMLANTDIDTGNIDLDEIIKNININISVRDCINNNHDTLRLLNKYGNKLSFDNIHYSVYSLYKVYKDGIYDIQNKNTLIEHDFGNVSNVIYTKSNHLYILCSSIGKMFKYNKFTNIITDCNYPNDYLFNTDYPPTFNEMRDGNIIIIGGIYINSMTITNRVMIYNTSLNTWSEGPPLPYKVDNHATVMDNTDIYVISGFCTNCITDVILYRDDEWQRVASLQSGRQVHIAFKRDNLIYAVGGKNFCTSVPNIERYDILTNQWNTIKTDVFNGSNACNSVYDANDHLFYMYENTNIYCVSLDNFTKTLKYSNIEFINNMTSKFIMM